MLRRPALVLLFLPSACHRAPAGPPVIPEPFDTRGEVVIAPELPPVPGLDGPLAVRVVYPPAGATIAATDSTFLFGTAGSGLAAVSINGHAARVWPNGAWLAWIPLPDTAAPVLRIVARKGDDSAAVDHSVKRAPRFRPPADGLWVDTASFTPSGRVWWPKGEPLRLRVRAAPNSVVRLRLADGRIVPFGATPAWPPVSDAIRAFDRIPSGPIDPQTDRYTGALSEGGVGEPLPLTGPAGEDDGGAAVLEVIRNGDTLRVAWPLGLTRLEPPWSWVELDDDALGRGGTDRLTVGRALPEGTYHWFFPTGTRAAVTGRVNGDLRLQLSPGQVAWVAAAEARPLPPGAAPGVARVGSITAAAGGQRAVLRLPLDWRVPFRVDEHRDGVTLRLYSAAGDPNWIRYGPAEGIVRLIEWAQAASEVVDVRVTLDRPLWGYRTRWEGSDLLLELRGRPAISPEGPLAGRRIVVDPGHPPAGSTGPSGLTEAEANLEVALTLERLLVEEGAQVVLTRRSAAPLDLWPRLRLADSLDADVLVSIHNNALPDGVNPFTNHGSSVFYFHPRSAGLARAIQRELARRLPVPVLGVGRADLAMVRGTWMPSVLVEGLFMILPDQEAALRTETGRRAYAEAVRAGLRAFLAEPEM